MRMRRPPTNGNVPQVVIAKKRSHRSRRLVPPPVELVWSCDLHAVTQPSGNETVPVSLIFTRAMLASAGINCRRMSVRLVRLSVCLSVTSRCSIQGRSRIFFFFWGGGINFYCTILQSYMLMSSAAISAQNNAQGLIFGVYIPIYPRRYGLAGEVIYAYIFWTKCSSVVTVRSLFAL